MIFTNTYILKTYKAVVTVAIGFELQRLFCEMCKKVRSKWGHKLMISFRVKLQNITPKHFLYGWSKKVFSPQKWLWSNPSRIVPMLYWVEAVQGSSPSVSTFFPISEFSFFVIRFLNHILFFINFSYFMFRFYYRAIK